jgi:hypothetical protein
LTSKAIDCCRTSLPAGKLFSRLQATTSPVRTAALSGYGGYMLDRLLPGVHQLNGGDLGVAAITNGNKANPTQHRVLNTLLFF